MIKASFLVSLNSSNQMEDLVELKKMIKAFKGVTDVVEQKIDIYPDQIKTVTNPFSRSGLSIPTANNDQPGVMNRYSPEEGYIAPTERYAFSTLPPEEGYRPPAKIYNPEYDHVVPDRCFLGDNDEDEV